mmetsp:Transcript_55666/g.97137  ORF Transcript_55666/g.97137 Transcript_55666/m.97137 type:complete len:211 (+) Transcript_55666:82-714(+)
MICVTAVVCGVSENLPIDHLSAGMELIFGTVAPLLLASALLFFCHCLYASKRLTPIFSAMGGGPFRPRAKLPWHGVVRTACTSVNDGSVCVEMLAVIFSGVCIGEGTGDTLAATGVGGKEGGGDAVAATERPSAGDTFEVIIVCGTSPPDEQALRLPELSVLCKEFQVELRHGVSSSAVAALEPLQSPSLVSTSGRSRLIRMPTRVKDVC